MDPRQDPDLNQPPVNEERRRLTKAGLAVPAVMGVLASRPVLGNTLHHCTPSGHISGFASPHTGAAPCRVGRPASYYSGSLANWPPEFKTTDKKGKTIPRDFKDSPHGAGLDYFADAYERLNTKNNKTSPATVLDVLAGKAMKNEFEVEKDTILRVKRNSVDLALGQEAVAACMNAMTVANFPIPPQRVVRMFNSVFTSGVVNVTTNSTWDRNQLKAYFQTLQA
jgi:hypothetical protein